MTRDTRDQDTREEASRTEEWNPVSLLPDPDPVPGWRFKWVRQSILGDTDVMNMSRRRREGWTPVVREEQPALAPFSESQDHIEVGGLLLCKLPEERAKARDRHFHKVAMDQVNGLSDTLRREAGEDRRMPLEEQRSTKISRSPG